MTLEVALFITAVILLFGSLILQEVSETLYAKSTDIYEENPGQFLQAYYMLRGLVRLMSIAVLAILLSSMLSLIIEKFS